MCLGDTTVSWSTVRGDTAVCTDDTTVSVLQNPETSFFEFLCTFKHDNGFQTPKPNVLMLIGLLRLFKHS